MKLTFAGAARMVTGSCYYLQAAGKKILVDCGMRQGKDDDIPLQWPFSPAEIDFLLLTHAHIDHSGLIPLLGKRGFTGQVLCTPVTKELCAIMLADSGHIQQMEAEWQNRKRTRAGKPPVEPIYTVQDAEACLRFFSTCEYNQTRELAPGLSVRFRDAGHLLGSASLEVFATEEGNARTLVFSGDVGNTDQPIIKDPDYITKGDIVLVESTYGDRSHPPGRDNAVLLADAVRETFARKGNLIIPAFAVGRTQELLYLFTEIRARNLLPEYTNFPVFVDSPLALEATEIFLKNTYGYYDAEAMQYVKNNQNPIEFPGLRTVAYAEQSRELNTYPNPAVIISSSGMCEAGRIKHHLKHNLWRPECTILFAGYQAPGTLGRSILDGASKVTIFGEEIRVYAQIKKLGNISGHADREGLLKWMHAFAKPPRQIYVVHGEETVAEGFAALLKSELHTAAYAPALNETVDLLAPETKQPAEPLPQKLSRLLQSPQGRELAAELEGLLQKYGG